MKTAFERIYATNAWLHGSGEGSLARNTGEYVAYLQRFLRERSIRSVVDFGCGDWQVSRLVDWSGIDYTGVDIVGSMIDANRAAFGAPNVRFVEMEDFDRLPAADLLVAKDVLQHWSTASIERFLPVIGRYRYALLTNCVKVGGPTVNLDIDDGGFRPLDLRSAPFTLRAKPVLEFENTRPWWSAWLRRPRWRKAVLLVENPRPGEPPAAPLPAAARRSSTTSPA